MAQNEILDGQVQKKLGKPTLAWRVGQTCRKKGSHSWTAQLAPEDEIYRAPNRSSLDSPCIADSRISFFSNFFDHQGQGVVQKNTYDSWDAETQQLTGPPYIWQLQPRFPVNFHWNQSVEPIRLFLNLPGSCVSMAPSCRDLIIPKLHWGYEPLVVPEMYGAWYAQPKRNSCVDLTLIIGTSYFKHFVHISAIFLINIISEEPFPVPSYSSNHQISFDTPCFSADLAESSLYACP